MDQALSRIKRYDETVALLPFGLRSFARLIDEMDKASAEEFRLRVGHVPSILLPEGEKPFSSSQITEKDLHAVIEIATNASLHTVRDSLKKGFITAKGGTRIGIGGEATVQNGEVIGFRHLSSLSLRIAKEVLGVAEHILPQLKEKGRLYSTLIISPPGGGKTTVLRDLIRLVSDGGRRVSIADERGELAALQGGRAQMDVGSRTDILTACPKDKAILQLLRVLNPEVIAVDEITAPEDKKALEQAANCGVVLLASAHAYDLDDLMEKPMYRQMIEEKLFRRVVIIGRTNSGRVYTVKNLEESLCLPS